LLYSDGAALAAEASRLRAMTVVAIKVFMVWFLILFDELQCL
jgi:hypothetical protein